MPEVDYVERTGPMVRVGTVSERDQEDAAEATARAALRTDSPHVPDRDFDPERGWVFTFEAAYL